MNLLVVRGFIVERRVPLARNALIAAGVFPLLIVGASVFFPEWLGKRFLIFYIAPVVLAAALWARLRLLESARWTLRTVLLDAVVLVIAAVRIGGEFLPVSGHMLFFTYSALTIRNRFYQALAFVLAVETTFFKLILWADQQSWTLGIVVGLAAALLFRRWAIRKDGEAGEST